MPAGFFFGSRQINAGSARARGVEAEFDWRPTPKLAVVLAYTYADSIITDNPEDPASVGKQQAGVPRHRASASLDWNGPFGVKLSPSVRYVSRTNGDSDGVLRTDPHFIADLAASARLSRGLEGFAQVENLFDYRYIGTNDGFSAPLFGTPVSVTAGVRVKF